MNEPIVNIDFCGIKKLLLLLERNGFSRDELQRIAARISTQSGADIILFR